MDFVEFSPAKINLTLRVLGRKSDGYHALFSLVCFADYGDGLTFSEGGAKDQLDVCGAFAKDIKGKNIILAASALLREEVPNVPFGVFKLEKKLPVASGMGGGSANAAAALRLLSRYVPSDFGIDRWQALALRLGADVPVCLKGETVYMLGIGDVLTPALNIEPQYAVLVNPRIGVSTAKVFQKLNAPPLLESEVHQEEGAIFDAQKESFKDYLLSRQNDLEKPAKNIEPEIKTVLEVLALQRGCFLSRMSGSGATCFGLFKTQAETIEAVRNIEYLFEYWWSKEVVLNYKVV